MFFADLDCFLTVFGFLPGFADLCWVLLGFAAFLIAGGERSERAKRASEALWRFLWVSLDYPCFRWRTLAFSWFLLLRFSAWCLAFSVEWYFWYFSPCFLPFNLVPRIS